MPLYEYGCDSCQLDFEQENRIVNRKQAKCPQCNEWAKQVILTAPRTDVYGSEQFCDVNDISYTSRREYERKMKAGGWEPAGDKVGGARSEHLLKNTIFSYGGQDNRSRTAEPER